MYIFNRTEIAKILVFFMTAFYGWKLLGNSPHSVGLIHAGQVSLGLEMLLPSRALMQQIPICTEGGLAHTSAG